MNPALPALGLSLVLLSGCASTPPAPPADVWTEAPADTYAVVAEQGGKLCVSPSLAPDTCFVGAGPDAFAFGLYRVTATRGDVVELRAAPSGKQAPAACAPAAYASHAIDLSLYARAAWLQPVTTAPHEVTFDDGTRVALAPGMPVQVHDDGTMAVLDDDWPLTVPRTEHAGSWFASGPRGPPPARPDAGMIQLYAFAAGDVLVNGHPVARDVRALETGYVSDEEMARRKAEADVRREALLAKPEEDLTPEERKRRNSLQVLAQFGGGDAFAPKVQAFDRIVAVAPAGPDTRLVTVRSRCIEVVAQVPAGAITQYGAMTMGLGGLGGGKPPVGFVPTGTAAWFADGTEAGTTQDELRVYESQAPATEAGGFCFVHRLFGKDSPGPRLCVDPGAVKATSDDPTAKNIQDLLRKVKEQQAKPD